MARDPGTPGPWLARAWREYLAALERCPLLRAAWARVAVAVLLLPYLAGVAAVVVVLILAGIVPPRLGGWRAPRR